MAVKKKISQARLIDLYMEAVAKEERKPYDVESFALEYDFEEARFFRYFEDFESLDKRIFKILFDTSVDTLTESADFMTFSKKDKLLSIYYTFFENLLLNRKFCTVIIKSYGLSWGVITLFSELKESFGDFIDFLELETLSLNIDQLETIQKKSIKEAAWVQFLLVLKFWMADESINKEKTDIFIEKSINTSVDLLNTQSLFNIIDLGKFLYAEKFKS